MTQYRYSTCVSFGTDGEADYVEHDVTVSYVVTWGRGETPPSYAHGGLPADPDEIDDIRVISIDGATSFDGVLALQIIDRIEETCFDDMLAEGQADELDAAEYRRESRAEDRWFGQ